VLPFADSVADGNLAKRKVKKEMTRRQRENEK
jgi:hypothetical protein